MVHKFLVAGLMAAMAPAAQAAQIVFNFDNFPATTVLGSHNGAVFTNMIVVNGGNLLGETSQPNSAVTNFSTFDVPAVAGFDFTKGFTAISFTAGVTPEGAVMNIYSGPGGTGSLLETINITNPPASPSAYAPFASSFSGVAKSVVITTPPLKSFGWDDVTITAVPEPESWALLITGFAAVGAAARRRRAQPA